MAKNDNSPVVRLYLASGLLRTPVEKRWDVLTGLLARAEDAKDHNLPNMYWYAAEGSVGADNGRAIKLLTEAKIPRGLPRSVSISASMISIRIKSS
jgi:hypothetical protein